MKPVKVFEDRSITLYLLEPFGFSSNVYAIVGKGVTLVDTGFGDEANRILPRLKQVNVKPSDIVTVIITHGHSDHIGGIAEIVGSASPTIMAHERLARRLANRFGLKPNELRDGDRIRINGEVDILHTPGHSAGSICIYDGERRILFTGDTVFPDGWFGRTDLPTGNGEDLVSSLRRLKDYDVEMIFPGHGDIARRGGEECVKKAYERASKMMLNL